MKLTIDPMTPNCLRVMTFLKYKGAEVPTEQISMMAKDQLSDKHKAINPTCTVPVLELDDGTKLAELPAIYLFLEQKFPDKPLLGEGATEQALVREWMHKIFLYGMISAAEMLRNDPEKIVFAHRAMPGPVNLEQIPDLVQRGQQRIEFFWSMIDQRLADNKFLSGDNFTAADIDLMCLYYFNNFTDLHIPKDAVNLQRWEGEACSIVSIT